MGSAARCQHARVVVELHHGHAWTLLTAEGVTEVSGVDPRENNRVLVGCLDCSRYWRTTENGLGSAPVWVKVPARRALDAWWDRQAEPPYRSLLNSVLNAKRAPTRGARA